MARALRISARNVAWNASSASASERSTRRQAAHTASACRRTSSSNAAVSFDATNRRSRSASETWSVGGTDASRRRSKRRDMAARRGRANGFVPHPDPPAARSHTRKWKIRPTATKTKDRWATKKHKTHKRRQKSESRGQKTKTIYSFARFILINVYCLLLSVLCLLLCLLCFFVAHLSFVFGPHNMLYGSMSTWNSTPPGGFAIASTVRSTSCRVALLSDCNWKWNR